MRKYKKFSIQQSCVTNLIVFIVINIIYFSCKYATRVVKHEILVAISLDKDTTYKRVQHYNDCVLFFSLLKIYSLIKSNIICCK